MFSNVRIVKEEVIQDTDPNLYVKREDKVLKKEYCNDEMFGGFGEVQVLVDELVEDIDPNLYVKRAEEFLKNGYYNDAIKEIDKAIEYGESKIQYIYQKVQILFVVGQYSNCYDLLMEEVYPKFESLSKQQKEEIYVYIAKCFKKCNFNPNKFEFVILAPNGEGMYNSIQEAINSTNKKIYLTEGIYNESILINKNVILDGNHATVKSNNSYGLVVKCGTSTISNIIFETVANVESCASTIFGGNIKFNGCTFINEKYHGIRILGNSNVEVDYSSVKANSAAISILENSKVNLINSKLNSTGGDICVDNAAYFHAEKSEFFTTKVKNSMCIYLSDNSKAEINMCKIYSADFGLINSEGANCIISNSNISDTGYGVTSEGDIEITNSIIRNNVKGIFILKGVANIIATNSSSNSCEGILVKEQPIVNISKCNFNGNETGGFFIRGKIKIEESNFYGNKLCGVNNQSKDITMNLSNSYDNGNAGVFSQEGGIIKISNSKVYCNKTPNITVTTNGVVNAIDCSISSGSSSGVFAYDYGTCNLTRCSIFKNAGVGVNSDSSGIVRKSDCNIYDNESIIGSLSGIRRFFRGI